MERGHAIGGALRPWRMAEFASIAPQVLAPTCLPPTCRLVLVRKVEHGNGHVAWRTPQVAIGVGLVQHCNASCWPLVDSRPSMMSCPDDVAVWATLWGDIVASTTGAVYRPNAVARLLADEGPQLLPCASVVVGVNVSGGLPSLSGCSSPRWLSVGSTWYQSWFVLVFVLCLTARLMSNGGSGAKYVTRKSTKLQMSWEWLPKCCILLTRAKACGCE